MKKFKCYIMTILGIILIIVGKELYTGEAEQITFLTALPYICLGVGGGIFAHGLGDIIYKFTMERTPEARRKLEIESKDERRIMIADKAKSKAFNMMSKLFGALMMIFAVTGVRMVYVLLFVFVYLFVHVYAIVCFNKFDNEM